MTPTNTPTLGVRRVAYDRQTVNHPSPLSRFAHRSRVKLSVDILQRYVDPSAAVLDFGCGPGLILTELRKRGHSGTLYGYEPFMDVIDPAILQIDQLCDIRPKSLSAIAAFETLEHICDAELTRYIHFCDHALTSQGHLVISVPIMLGPAVIAKELTRSLLFRRAPEYSLSEIIRAAFLMKSPERPADRLGTHKGFDYRQIHILFSAHFAPVRVHFSPFPYLPWLMNSQVFYVYRKRSS